MPTTTFVIDNEIGLHARPAALFVQTAGKFKSTKIKVKNTTRGTPYVDAKSIISVLGLGVSSQHEIEVTAEGDQADNALEALAQLIENDFADPKQDG